MKKPLAGRTLPHLAMAVVLLLGSGCSVITQYPDQMHTPLQDLEQGRFDTAYASVAKHFDGGLDRLLYLLEGGTILHCQGDGEKSNQVFTQAGDVIRAYQEKAVISLSQGAAQLGSLLVNEKTLPYQGEPYERVQVNTLKAMNYLCLRQVEDARVEIRRSFAVQEKNREIHQKEIASLEEAAARQGIASEPLMQEVDPYYQADQKYAAGVANPYEDPFAYYLSAIVYEVNGEYNDAFIDLKNVQRLQPGVPCVENDLMRTAKLAGMPDALREWKQTLRREPRFVDPKQEGELLLLFECGMAPRKTQIKITLPIPYVGLVSVAFPKYQQVPGRVRSAALYNESRSLLASSAVLTDVNAIAFRSLHDQMPILVLKQAIRAAAKGAMAKTAGDQAGWAGLIAASAYNVISEQADLRSWLTLPQSYQVARVPLTQGNRHLVLSLGDGTGQALQEQSFSLNVKPGTLALLHVRAGTQGLIAFHLYAP
jgi:uncharacterized protein